MYLYKQEQAGLQRHAPVEKPRGIRAWSSHLPPVTPFIHEVEQQRYLSAPPWTWVHIRPEGFVAQVTDQLSTLLQERGEPEEAGHR